MKSWKNSKARERAILAPIDDPSRYSPIITQLMRLTRSARIAARPRISSANHPIKQHLACPLSVAARSRAYHSALREVRWGRGVAVPLRNALHLGGALYSDSRRARVSHALLPRYTTASQRCVPSFDIHRSAGMWSCLCIIPTICTRIYRSSTRLFLVRRELELIYKLPCTLNGYYVFVQ